ncbi:MAG: hypothetical protein KGZ25_04360 [Planctomycetes bacterium]|nr:hypothetical protein [Planctomycetota bacterium]
MISTEQLRDSLEQDKFYAPIFGDDGAVLERKKGLVRRTYETFLAQYGDVDRVGVFHVPGRLEFTAGKHTDYVGLPVPNFAVDRGFIVLAAPGSDDMVSMAEADDRWARIAFDSGDLGKDIPPLEVPFRAEGKGDRNWRRYPMSVLQRLLSDFDRNHNFRGARLAFSSDLPPASGMSSSSALMVMTLIGYSSATGLLRSEHFRGTIAGRDYEGTLQNLALYAACCENGADFRNVHKDILLEGRAGVGTFGGSQDHVAMLLGRRGYLGINDFRPIRHIEDIPWPDDLAVVVCYAQPASKTESAREGFNRLRRRADEVAKVVGKWAGKDGGYQHIGAVIDDIQSLERDKIENLLRSKAAYREDKLLARWEMACVQAVRHLPEVIECLRESNYPRLGEVTNREHALSYLNLENISPLVDTLQKCAVVSGAYGASGFGGGFGGSLFSLVGSEESGEFMQEWRERGRPHLEKFQETRPDLRYSPTFFQVRPSSGACRLFEKERRLFPSG